MKNLTVREVNSVGGGMDAVEEVAIGAAVGLLAIGAAPFVAVGAAGAAVAGVVAYATVGGSIAASGIAIADELF